MVKQAMYPTRFPHHPDQQLQAGNNNKHLDAGCKRGLMSLANGSRGMSGANARFVDNIRPDKTIAVKATKNIRHNKEIVVHYGKIYFDSMKKNTNKTK